MHSGFSNDEFENYGYMLKETRPLTTFGVTGRYSEALVISIPHVREDHEVAAKLNLIIKTGH